MFFFFFPLLERYFSKMLVSFPFQVMCEWFKDFKVCVLSSFSNSWFIDIWGFCWVSVFMVVLLWSCISSAPEDKKGRTYHMQIYILYQKQQLLTIFKCIHFQRYICGFRQNPGNKQWRSSLHGFRGGGFKILSFLSRKSNPVSQNAD